MEVMGPKCQWDGTWVYLPIGAALEMVGLEEIGLYITHLHNTVAQYIATFPIMEFCLAAERKPGMRISRRWWDHPALNIQRIRTWSESAEGGEETRVEESEGEGE